VLGQHPGRTFISYSRKDGAKFAADLRKTLEKENLSVWQDIVALEGGRDWWSQIEDALKSKALQHFVLIVTPAALESCVVRREIRLARQEGKTVCPIKGPDLGDLGKLPRWLGQLYDLDLPEHKTTLIRVLQDESRQKRVAMMAPEPPADFVERPKEFDALKKQLLDAKGDAVAITAALRGAGGYGKTTLAKALAHDQVIQDAYFDGILWAELGEKPENLLSILSDLITRLTGERPGLETVNAAASALGEALGDRRILMIVDDAWREPDLRPFLQGGSSTTRLVTTRIDSVLPQNAIRQPVDAMQEREALNMLAAGLPQDQASAERGSLSKLAARLGEWAQLLKLVNGFLRDRVVNSHQPLKSAILDANDGLDTEGLVAFDPSNEQDRTKAIARTISVSLGLLEPSERARFDELGVFPEDTDIPIAVVERLWGETAGLKSFAMKKLLSRLYGRSLLLNLDLNQRILRLHDTIRHFLQDCTGKDRLLAQHKRLIPVLEGIGTSPDNDALTRRYFYLYLPYHLAAAKDREKLDALLLDPAWLKAKLEVTGSPSALVADYAEYGATQAQKLIGRTLQMTAGICARDPRQLLPQLLGRLPGFEAIIATGFLDNARRSLSPPAILTSRPSLTPLGAETARLEGHSDSVLALCPLPDGRLASGGGDNTIRLWDVATGAETARLEGHSGDVWALCLLPDGRLASGGGDNTIRLWDVATGAETARLEGHLGDVWALCLLPDGRLASGSLDRFIRLWDVATGAETGRLEGHLSPVNALCLLPDGRLASGSLDGTIRLWDVTRGAETARLEGHSDSVLALCPLPDGRLASGGGDHTVRLWDVTRGAETARLEGNLESVLALRPLPDGRLASGSQDNTVRLWDVTRGAETARLEGHSGHVVALCPLPDGRLASAAYEKTIRLWDLTSGAETARLEGHSGFVSSLCLLADGRLASGSWDYTIRLWDVATGAETARLEGGVSSLCLLADGRLASGSWDKTIRLWDVMSGAETARLEGLWGPVLALCLLPDGQLASSGSWESTIRLWDVTRGVETARLEGHSRGVAALCLTPDGRLASGSWDSTIRLWDVATGAATARLEGHSDRVTTLCLLPDGRLASGSWDKTIRLWDMPAEREITRLEIDAPVLCLATIADNRLVAGDQLGRLHWLELVL
jgi:WD40 repeat protein